MQVAREVLLHAEVAEPCLRCCFLSVAGALGAAPSAGGLRCLRLKSRLRRYSSSGMAARPVVRIIPPASRWRVLVSPYDEPSCSRRSSSICRCSCWLDRGGAGGVQDGRRLSSSPAGQLPARVLVFTLLATWIGSGSLFGGAGLGYRSGFAALWQSAGAWAGIALVYFIAPRVQATSRSTRCPTSSSCATAPPRACSGRSRRCSRIRRLPPISSGAAVACLPLIAGRRSRTPARS